MVVLGRMADITPAAVHYLNRVGDLLFAMARRANKDSKVPDIPWRAGEQT